MPDVVLNETRQIRTFMRLAYFAFCSPSVEPWVYQHCVEIFGTTNRTGFIRAPDVVGPLDRHAAQQVWVDPVARRRTAQVRLRLPKDGRFRYNWSSWRSSRRFSALSGPAL